MNKIEFEKSDSTLKSYIFSQQHLIFSFKVCAQEVYFSNLHKATGHFLSSVELMIQSMDEMSLCSLKLSQFESGRREPNASLQHALRQFAGAADAAHASLKKKFIKKMSGYRARCETKFYDRIVFVVSTKF